MDELGLKEYDDEMIKVYSALQIIDSKKTKLQKAKLITELIKK